MNAQITDALAHNKAMHDAEREASLDTSEDEAAVTYEQWRDNPSAAYKPAHGGYPEPVKGPAP